VAPGDYPLIALTSSPLASARLYYAGTLVPVQALALIDSELPIPAIED
jgi:hypothetical protein